MKSATLVCAVLSRLWSWLASICCRLTSACDSLPRINFNVKHLREEAAVQLPDVLYHYCPSPALPEILRSRVLWLTHQSGLNDLREAVWVVPFIQDEIRRRQTDATKEFFIQLRHQFDLNVLSESYVASFSSDGDVLSQWRAYGMDGDGFAIGFRPQAFRAQLGTPMTSAVPEHTVGFLKVHYDNEMLKAKIAAILDHHVSVAHDGNNIIECSLKLRALALSFKNPAFREEDEWRVCYSPLISTHQETRDLEIVGMLRELRFRASRYGVLPYFQMSFGDNAREDAIAEIVVGPKNLSNDNLLKMLLLSLDYRNASVRRSSASYR